jgi:hypothetical protein
MASSGPSGPPEWRPTQRSLERGGMSRSLQNRHRRRWICVYDRTGEAVLHPDDRTAFLCAKDSGALPPRAYRALEEVYRPLSVMTADSGRWPGRSSVRGPLRETAPGQGCENQADDGEQRWDRQSEAVPERRLDWEQPKLQQGSRAFAGPQ